LNDQWVATLRTLSPEELIVKFHATTQQRRESLSRLTDEDLAALGWTPVGEAPLRRFLEIRVFDCYVHEQDLRLSLSLPGHQSGEVPEFSMNEIERALGFIVGKQAQLPPTTSIRIHLEGGVERVWNILIANRAQLVNHLDNPTCELQLDSTLFLQLACGRIDPLKVTDRIQRSGDTALVDRVIQHLAFTI
jgi:uncharacterized protein (TIGR03083 family)